MSFKGDRFDRLAGALLDRLLGLRGDNIRERQHSILAVEVERIDRGAFERGSAPSAPPPVPKLSEKKPDAKACPLCRARRVPFLRTGTLDNVIFVCLVTGITIGQTEAMDERWCTECREYVERLTSLGLAMRRK